MTNKQKHENILSLMPTSAWQLANKYNITRKAANMRLSYYESIGLIERTGEKDGRFLVFDKK